MLNNMLMKWTFSDSLDVAVFTNKRIVGGGDWIQQVSHDSDDGAWQFHPAGGTSENEASVVSLKTIVEIDPSVISLADLPLGWQASRKSMNSEWQRLRKDRSG